MAKTQVKFIGGKPAPAGDYPENFFVPNFINSWLEYASQKYEQIFKGGSQSGTGLSVVYTVPAGSVFFWVGYSASYNNNIEFGTVQGTAPAQITFTNVQDTATFGMYFKLPAGSQIAVGGAGAGNIANLKIWGFLVPASA